jgi:hypothetical protein
MQKTVKYFMDKNKYNMLQPMYNVDVERNQILGP